MIRPETCLTPSPLSYKKVRNGTKNEVRNTLMKANTMRESSQAFGKSTSSGRDLLLLVAAGLLAALGVVAYSGATLSDIEDTARDATQFASSFITSPGSHDQINASIDQTMQKIATIVSSTPPHARATVVLVGGGLVAFSPIVIGTMPPVIVYSAAKMLLPDVIKFISP